MKLTVVGCSPAWPNPGGAQSGYLVEGSGRLLLDCGPGVLAEAARAARRAGRRSTRSSISHWHLDHWGDLVPWVWGRMFGLGRDAAKRPSSGFRPDGSELLRTFGEQFGTPTMFWNAFEMQRVRGGAAVRDRGRADDHADPGSALHAADLTPSASRTATRRSPTRATRHRATRSPRSPATPTSSSARRRSARATPDGHPRGHLSADEAVAAFRLRARRRLLITHRPRGARPRRRSWSALRTGSSSTCRAGRPAPHAVAGAGRGSRRTRSRRRRPPTIRPTGTNSQTAPSCRLRRIRADRGCARVAS